MLVAVIAVFVLCWTPTSIINILKAFDQIDEMNEGILRQCVTSTYSQRLSHSQA